MKSLCKVLVMILLVLVRNQTTISENLISEHNEVITYCELINDKDKYVGKTVRVKGIYRYVFEVQELYCGNCLEREDSAWVEFEKELCENSRKTKPFNPKNKREGATIKVIFVGKLSVRKEPKFENGKGYVESGFGHLGRYEYEFKVSCIESAKTLFDGRSPSSLPTKIFTKTYCE